MCEAFGVRGNSLFRGGGRRYGRAMGFAEDLVAAPRGRRLCFSAVASGRLVAEFDVATRRIAEFFEGLGQSGIEALGARDEAALLPALADSTDRAMYWQEPDQVDQALAAPEIRSVLLPAARAIAAAPGALWWSAPIDLDRQFHVQIEQACPPTARPVADELAEWRTTTVEDELRARSRPADPAAPVSGYWWSAPSRNLVNSTRSRFGAGALGLCLQEDGFGPERAWCRSVRPLREPRVYEITGPQAWCELAERYPLEVSLSRRHDWWKVSGWAGRWVIPDWTAVAADHDAVHLTCTGYLTTAGRALPVGKARTMVAGWDPDQTYWLTDAIELGDAVCWRGDPGDLTSWAPTESAEAPPGPPAPAPRRGGWRRLRRLGRWLRARPSATAVTHRPDRD